MCLPAIIGDKWSDRKINKERLRVLTRCRRQVSRSSLLETRVAEARRAAAPRTRREIALPIAYSFAKTFLERKKRMSLHITWGWTRLPQDRSEEEYVGEAGAQVVPEPTADTRFANTSPQMGSGEKCSVFLAFELRLICC